MSRLKGLAARARAWLRPHSADARLDEEFRFHVDTETQNLIRHGVPPAEARRRALLAFGAIESHRETMRDERGGRWLADLGADLRTAGRSMRRHPGFMLAVTVTLALGIGVNGIVFGYVNSLLFRPIPVEGADDLVALFTRDQRTGQTGPVAYDDFVDYRDRSLAFDGLAAMMGVPVTLAVTEPGGPVIGDMVWAELVTEDFFEVVGARPAAGRFFTAADAPRGGNPFVVLSFDAWQRRFHGDPQIIGRPVRINGREFVITGVAPQGFRGMRLLGFWPELWIPGGMQPAVQPRSKTMLQGRGAGSLLVVGRRRQDFDLARTQMAATEFARHLEAAHPASNANIGVTVVPAAVGVENPGIIKPTILILSSTLGIVGAFIVLLIICANLAVLQIARTAARAREIAIRLSLGCSRRRLTRQLLVESLVLAIPGVFAGAALLPLASVLEPLLSPKFAFQVGLGPTADVRVMLFTGSIALVAAALFGIVPAIRGGRSLAVPSAHGAIGAGRAGSARPSRVRGVLVVSQLAMTTILIVAAILLTRSLRLAANSDVGFKPQQRVLISMNVGLQGYDEPRGQRLYDEVLTRARQLPGVVSASFSYPAPFDSFDRSVRLHVEGLANTRDGTLSAQLSVVGDGFIPALGLRLQGGRDFTPKDGPDAALVMIVSDSLASRLWPGVAPVGQRARLGSGSGPVVTAVGVVADAKFAAVGETTTLRAYLPVKQTYRDWQTLVVHTRDTPAKTIANLREVIAAADPQLPPFGALTLEQAVTNGHAGPRTAAAIAGFFGVLALLIASVGLYAVVARSVADRTREVGVRIALGSTPRRVVRHFMGDGARLGIIGLAVGLTVALGVTRAMSGVLMGLSPWDPTTFALVPIVLGLVVVVATFLPARRVGRLDAVEALRTD